MKYFDCFCSGLLAYAMNLTASPTKVLGLLSSLVSHSYERQKVKQCVSPVLSTRKRPLIANDSNHLQEQSKHKEQGNILFAALMLLLVMNLLGVGLMQDAIKEQKLADYKRVDNTLFHLTESCARDAMAWLKAQNRPSDVLPHVITYADVTHLLDGDEPTDLVNQMQGYSYNCTINQLISKTSEGEMKEVGETVGVSDSYDGSDLSPKFFYEIAANGQGPDGANKQITTLVSVTY